MTIAVGDTLPDATFLKIGAEGPEEVALGALVKGRKVVIFGLPGAYTGVCSESHVPSFIRSMDALKAKGVDEVVCLAVNDPFVMSAWEKSTGADAAGITSVTDPTSAFTKAIGMDFDAPPVGFIARCKRHAMYVEDGVVKVLHVDDNPGTCDLSAGESMVDAI